MHTYVILTAVSYDGMKQRPQHMADYLALTGNRVLYVNLSKKSVVEESIFDGLFLDTDNSPLVTQRDTNLFLMDGLEKENADHRRGLDELLVRIERFYGSQNTTFIVAYPEWVEYIGQLSPETFLVYDCIDDWDEFVHDIQWYDTMVTLHERKMAMLSDLVITSSKRLFAKMYRLNKNVYYMPNGVRPEDYAMEPELPVDLIDIPKPYVFFMGALAGWVDIELIYHLASNRPNYSFVFVGNQHRTELPQLENVYFLGKKPYNQLVHYVKHCSVAIIPFKVNRLTASVTPLKFYEYISAGIPTVTTLLPDLVGVDGADLAGDYDEFLERVDYYVNLADTERDRLAVELSLSSRRFAWDYLLGNFLEFAEDVDKSSAYSVDFIARTIQEYELSMGIHLSLANELVSFYNLRGDYESAARVGSVLLEKPGHYDYEQLALAFFRLNRTEEMTQCLELIPTKSSFKYYRKFIEYLLSQKGNWLYLEALLLKLSGFSYEAMRLLDEELSRRTHDAVALGLMASLYTDVYEFDIAFEFLSASLQEASGVQGVVYDPYMCMHLVTYLVKNGDYGVAEDLALQLYLQNLSGVADDLLAFVYFHQALSSQSSANGLEDRGG